MADRLCEIILKNWLVFSQEVIRCISRTPTSHKKFSFTGRFRNHVEARISALCSITITLSSCPNRQNGNKAMSHM